MLDFTYHMTLNHIKRILRENVKMQHYNGCHYVTLLNMQTTSCLSN